MKGCFVIGVKEHDGKYCAIADEIKVETDMMSFLKAQARNVATWRNVRWGAEGKYNSGSEENGKYYGGTTQQGMCYKDEEKFLFSPEEICYCSEADLENCHFSTENNKAGWTGNDIIELFCGDVGLAYYCFLGCNWQSPSTWKDEMEQFEEPEDIADMSQRGKEIVERVLRKERFE